MCSWVVVGPASRGCPVEVAVGGFYKPGVRPSAVSAVMLRTKSVQGGQRTAGSDFEDRTMVAGPASRGCPVEVAVGVLQQTMAKPSVCMRGR